MASHSSISIFQKLEKFSGKNNEDLTSWLRGFERCLVIAGKTDDDLVKGQLLILCLCGQALAVAERLEEEKKTPQKYADLKAKLEAVFNSNADKEYKQEQFESSHQELNETEDEFMLRLLQLHRSANPTATTAENTRNVKRKFLNGISPEVKKNIFIFCNDPHASTVSVDSLLEAIRKAKLYISGKGDTKSNSNVVNEKSDNNDIILKAIDELRQSLDSHIKSTKEQFAEQGAQLNGHIISDINAIDENRGFSRDIPNNRGRGSFRGGYFRNQGSRGRGNRQNNGRNPNQNPITCYKCSGLNHVARDCRYRPSLN